MRTLADNTGTAWRGGGHRRVRPRNASLFASPRGEIRGRSASADSGLSPWRHGAEIDERLGCLRRPCGAFQCCFAAAPAQLRYLDGASRRPITGGRDGACGRRRIRLLDGTTVPKAGREARENNGLWRLHCAFDLPAERFGFIELTDEKGGERLDRAPVAEGDILIAGKRTFIVSGKRSLWGSCLPILWRMS